MGPTLITYGREDQQAEFLPSILTGDSTWCIGMSEPNAGSDLASLKTQAVRDGDDWVINGQKIWTSFGEVADYCYLICRTSTDGPPHAGISEIIVPMNTPGIEVRPIKDMTTNRHFCEVFFTDVRVPVINLVGVEGNAFKQTMRQLEHERGGIDRLVSNYALYVMALERADKCDPRVRQEIARLEMKYRIGRILVIREVLRQAPAGFSAATKCFCTEHEWDVAQFVMQTLGPEATLWDQTSQGFANVPAARWREAAQKHAKPLGDGLQITYDPALRDSFMAAMATPASDAWPLFDACAGLPMAVIRGAHSDLLSAATLAEMASRLPRLIVANVADRAHVPFLDEPESVAALAAFQRALS
jgi:alkylation response protein AidB-like acyl-CoA dehydrogenase